MVAEKIKVREFCQPDIIYNVVFANVLVGMLAVVLMKLPGVIWDGGVYFLTLFTVGAGGFYFGGKLQTQYKTHNILERSLEDENAETPDYIAGNDVKPHEISALLNTIVHILKPGIIDGLRDSLQEPQEVGGGYTLYVKQFELDQHKIVFQDTKVLHKSYLESTELLLTGKLFLAGDPDISIALKNSSKLKPNIEGDINKLDLSANIYCKLCLDSYILTIWFEGGVKPDIDMDIDVSIFPLALDFITEVIVRTCFSYTEEKPLIIELIPSEDPAVAQSPSQASSQYIDFDDVSEQSSTVYMPDEGILRITNMRAEKVAAKDMGNTSDPYLKIIIGDKKYKTKYIRKTLNPKWKETFQIPIRNTLESIKFEVKDYDMIGKDDICGHVVKQISKFAKTEEMTSYELLLVPQGVLKFDAEWHSDLANNEPKKFQRRKRKICNTRF